jgi:hypothetical protein
MTFSLTATQLIRIMSYTFKTLEEMIRLRSVSRLFKETIDYDMKDVWNALAPIYREVGKMLCRNNRVYVMDRFYYYNVPFDSRDILGHVQSNEMCLLLMSKGFNVNDTSYIMMAIHSINPTTIGILLKHMKEPFITSGYLAIVAMTNVEMCLLKRCGFEINAKSKAMGDTIAHLCFRNSVYSCFFLNLVRHGARIDIKNNNGLTALDILISKYSKEALYTLIMKQKSMIVYGPIQETFLYQVIQSHDITSILPLLLAGANPNEEEPRHYLSALSMLKELVSEPSDRWEEYVAKLDVINTFLGSSDG